MFDPTFRNIADVFVRSGGAAAADGWCRAIAESESRSPSSTDDGRIPPLRARLLPRAT